MCYYCSLFRQGVNLFVRLYVAIYCNCATIISSFSNLQKQTLTKVYWQRENTTRIMMMMMMKIIWESPCQVELKTDDYDDDKNDYAGTLPIGAWKLIIMMTIIMTMMMKIMMITKWFCRCPAKWSLISDDDDHDHDKNDFAGALPSGALKLMIIIMIMMMITIMMMNKWFWRRLAKLENW